MYPREIFKEALFLNANAIMLAHNHPSGDLTPSKSDIEITNHIQQGMELMGLKLLDHIIVGGKQAVSLLKMGKMPTTKTPEASRFETPLGENVKKYGQAAKQPSIKQQLSFAKKQLSREPVTTTPPKRNHDRGYR